MIGFMFLTGCKHRALMRPRRNCLTDDGGLQVDHDGAWHVLAGARLAEERAERVVSDDAGAADVVVRHGAVSEDAVLEAVELPARVADLHARLAHVDRDTLPL